MPPRSFSRPRYQTSPWWKPWSSANSTGPPSGTGVVLWEVVRPATVQAESSKSGSDSGFSVRHRQPSRAGSATARTAGISPSITRLRARPT